MTGIAYSTLVKCVKIPARDSLDTDKAYKSGLMARVTRVIGKTDKPMDTVLCTIKMGTFM